MTTDREWYFKDLQVGDKITITNPAERALRGKVIKKTDIFILIKVTGDPCIHYLSKYKIYFN